MKNTVLLFALLLSFLPAAYSQSNVSDHKLVIQLVNGDSLSHFGLMKNLKNLTAGWPELEIEVVCHGPGLALLHKKKSKFLVEVEHHSDAGVTFVACENTMKAKNILKPQITDKAKFVPMGIKEIVLKQEDGWSYIKAGIVKP